jgi:hypothetical protein
MFVVACYVEVMSSFNLRLRRRQCMAFWPIIQGLEKHLNSLFQSRASIPFPDFAGSEPVFRKQSFCHQNVWDWWEMMSWFLSERNSSFLYICVNGKTYIRPGISWQPRRSMTDRSVTTIIVVLLISYPMVQQDINIANDGGTDIYRRRLQNRQMSVCHRCI